MVEQRLSPGIWHNGQPGGLKEFRDRKKIGQPVQTTWELRLPL
jgi:hypothetical protein